MREVGVVIDVLGDGRESGAESGVGSRARFAAVSGTSSRFRPWRSRHVLPAQPSLGDV